MTTILNVPLWKFLYLLMWMIILGFLTRGILKENE